jgi:hypothetical protein
VVVAEVVVTVSVAVCAVVPATLTELVTPQVAGLVAPAGIVVTAQDRLTVPVKPLEGVTVTLAVLPVVAAAANEMFPPLLRAKLGAVVTVTVFDPDAIT